MLNDRSVCTNSGQSVTSTYHRLKSTGAASTGRQCSAAMCCAGSSVLRSCAPAPRRTVTGELSARRRGGVAGSPADRCRSGRAVVRCAGGARDRRGTAAHRGLHLRSVRRSRRVAWCGAARANSAARWRLRCRRLCQLRSPAGPPPKLQGSITLLRRSAEDLDRCSGVHCNQTTDTGSATGWLRRRLLQGISIDSAGHCLQRRCNLHRIRRTRPQFALRAR